MMTNNIELPALPRASHTAGYLADSPKLYDGTLLQDYARAAVEADRKRRGEPVAWVKQDIVENQFINMRPRRIWWECNEGIGMPIFTAPQSAEPVKLECPKCGADRSKVPCAGELMNCHFKGEAQPAQDWLGHQKE